MERGGKFHNENMVDSCVVLSGVNSTRTLQLNNLFKPLWEHEGWNTPGSVDEAEVLLQASNQIEHKSIFWSEEGIRLLWYTRKTEYSYSYVYLTTNNDLVQTIHFTTLSNFTLEDIINFLDEPSEISISMQKTADAWINTYTLYYPQSKTMIYSGKANDLTGPSPDEYIEILSLNADFDSDDLPPWRADDYENRQPWLGYGHLEEYLPGVEIP
jgi:hypothetical protein